MATKKRVKKPSNPSRIRTEQGFLRHAMEGRFYRIKGEYVSISGPLYSAVQEVTGLCAAKEYGKAQQVTNNLPEKSYVGLPKGVEQQIIREEVAAYIRDCITRDQVVGE